MSDDNMTPFERQAHEAKLFDSRRAAEKELATLRKDKARLDWLLQQYDITREAVDVSMRTAMEAESE